MNKKEFLIIAAIAIAGVLLHLAFCNNMGFHRDELLYLSQTLHPSFGYFSVPPFTAWIGIISVKIFGYNLFAAKFIPALAGGLVVILGSMMAKEMGGRLFAMILTAVALSGSLLFLRAFYLFQPVPFDIMFWTIELFILLKYINTNSSKYILYLGIFLGIGLLNKYNPGFLLIAFLISLPFTKYRELLISKYFYIAAGIAFVIVLPNIIWQLTHGLPVVHHMQELSQTQLVNMSAGLFLKEQLLMILPGTLVAVPGFAYLLISKRFAKYRLVAYICLATIIIFIILKGKTYYTGGIYPLLIAAGAIVFEKWLKSRLLQGFLLIFLIISAWLLLPMGIPVYSPERMVAYFDKFEEITGIKDIRRDEDNQFHPLPQDYSDMLGWKELTEITAKAWDTIKDKNSSFIYAENYGQAGAIAVIGKHYNLPEPVSFNESFAYWAPKSFPKEIQTIIYINDEMGDDVKDLFSSIEIAGKIEDPLARERGTTVWVCSRPVTSFNRFWEEIVKR